MKILAVGMNYAAHNKELNNTFLPTEPVIFSKPESALTRDGKPFFVPDFAERFDYETEIVVRINKLGKNIAERFAHRYYDE
jgi:2-keto-4-pentenoate hydratase/2-oxohepta-3-ene-1,7-dioic acid hydratase in catechol pathway